VFIKSEKAERENGLRQIELKISNFSSKKKLLLLYLIVRIEISKTVMALALKLFIRTAR
jgi:hypothetical protein